MPEWLLLIVYCKCQIRFRKDASCIYNLTLFPSSKSKVLMLTQICNRKTFACGVSLLWQKAKPGEYGNKQTGHLDTDKPGLWPWSKYKLKKRDRSTRNNYLLTLMSLQTCMTFFKKEDILRTNNGSQWEPKYLYILKNNNRTYLPLSSAGESQSMTEFSFRVNNPFKYIFSKKGAK